MHRGLATGLAAVAAIASLALPSAAPAQRSKLIVGIGDQKPETFTDQRFRSLGLRHTRYIVPWNGVFADPVAVDRWMTAARAAGLQPLIAFSASADSRCPKRPCRAPSVAAYRRAVNEFRRRYPWVRTYQAWNEGNHQSQPTGKNPKRAAQYYNALRALCRGCKVVAADVLDSNNMERWLKTFQRHAKRPRVWGLHNYTDTNRFRRTGTRRLLKAVKGEVWMTETGGIVRFTTDDGRLVFRNDPARAARATRFAFTLARLDRKRIKRVYLYHWSGRADNRFDSGLVDENGLPRPGFFTFRDILGSFGQLPAGA